MQDKHLSETQVEDSLSEFLHVIAGLDEGHGDPIRACPAGKINILFVLDKNIKEHLNTSELSEVKPIGTSHECIRTYVYTYK